MSPSAAVLRARVRRGLARAALAALVLGGPGALAAAAAEARPVLPPPDLSALLRLAAPALDKPPVSVPPVPLPPPPEALPELPPVRPASDLALRPVAPLPPARVLACNPLGSVFGVVSELLECGRARYGRNELEEARADLQAVVQRGTDRLVIREGRYWLAETQVRLGQRDAAASQLDLVMRDDPRGELGFFAAHSLGWLLVERGEAARALPLFEGLLRGGAPPDLIPTARHGRAMALYGLGRLAEAREEWTGLLGQSIPRPLATEVTFWLGDVLGRLGDAPGAVTRLVVFTAAGPRLHIDAGLLRLAWWRRVAGDALSAVKDYRGLLSAYPRSPEIRWARAGLALALLDLDDGAGAIEEIRRLEAADPAGTLARPLLLLAARRLVERGRAGEAAPLLQDLLGRSLPGPSRAYVLVLSGELARGAAAPEGAAGAERPARGEPTEARAAFEQARAAAGPDAVGAFAALRLAQMELALHEAAEARVLAESLLGEAIEPSIRRAALVVAGESAYGAREYERAAGLYRRLAGEAPEGETRSAALLALGWAEYRRGRADEARRVWTGMAGASGRDPRLAGALLLAAELAGQAGDDAAALGLLDRLVADFPEHEHATVARLDRAILRMRGGAGADVADELGALLARATLSPYLGRIRLARAVALVRAGRSAEAREDFEAALAQGEDAARLGLGVMAFGEGRWDDAIRDLTSARAATAGPIADTAEYGIAAAAFNQGRLADFKRLAGAVVAGMPRPVGAPHLLHGLAIVAAEEQRWADARELPARLARDYAAHAASADADAGVAARAAAAGQWPLARELYQRLADRHPQHPGNRAGELDFAEALIRTGAAAAARPRLEAFVRASAADPRLPRAQLLLARAYEEAGDRAAALELYGRVRQEHPAAAGAERAAFAQGRLLVAEGRFAEARPLLDHALDTGDAVTAGEAAYLLGEGQRGAGQLREAAESYMTAAYLAPEAPWARRALLAAAQTFAALKQREAAATVYRKLLATAGIEPELADVARRELAALPN